MNTNPNFPYLPPADWHDFTPGSADDLNLVGQLNTNLIGFTAQNVIGNPWLGATAFPVCPAYFSPGTANDPGNNQANTPSAAVIEWGVFPGRLGQYFPSMSQTDQNSICDTGYDTQGHPIPHITKDPCSGATEDLAYGPYGPRGWQDEYCEWCVVYDLQPGESAQPGISPIKRVDFTCENPEYITSLWLTSPQKVAEIYQSALDQPNITVQDLYLKDSNGNPVTDPVTNQYIYDTLNKWNCGPQCEYDSNGSVLYGGAMHLTSTPNTIQTEIAISAYATVPRASGNQDNNSLICCGQFGQIYRNSDPNIGAGLNNAVNGALAPGASPTSVNNVALINPPGLYMQYPDYTKYSWASSGNAFTQADMDLFFTVKRGYRYTSPDFPQPLQYINQLLDQKGEGPYDFILHLTFQVPADRKITDILINNEPVTWAGQIALTMRNHVVAIAYAGTTPQTVSACIGDTPQVYDQPVQLFHKKVFDVMSTTEIPAPSYTVPGAKALLLYNSTFIAPFANQASSPLAMVLTAVLTGSTAAVTFSQNGGTTNGITATVTGIQNDFKYCVPGNSYPGTYNVITLDVTIAPGCALGVYDVSINGGPAMPALLNVIA